LRSHWSKWNVSGPNRQLRPKKSGSCKKSFAEDFLGTDIDGKLYTKSQKIAEEKAQTSTGEVLSPHLDDVKVRFFGDNVAV
jgi:hypothetical protein